MVIAITAMTIIIITLTRSMFGEEDKEGGSKK
jgi:hypothetical protein